MAYKHHHVNKDSKLWRRLLLFLKYFIKHQKETQNEHSLPSPRENAFDAGFHAPKGVARAEKGEWRYRLPF